MGRDACERDRLIAGTEIHECKLLDATPVKMSEEFDSQTNPDERDDSAPDQSPVLRWPETLRRLGVGLGLLPGHDGTSRRREGFIPAAIRNLRKSIQLAGELERERKALLPTSSHPMNDTNPAPHTDSEELVFVYGTLMRGFGRNFVMPAGTFRGEARTTPDWKLYHLGDYPGIVHSDDGAEVHGELYAVTEELLAQLDDIEGVDAGLYSRERVSLASPSDGQAWIYVYQRSVDHAKEMNTRWGL